MLSPIWKGFLLEYHLVIVALLVVGSIWYTDFHLAESLPRPPQPLGARSPSSSVAAWKLLFHLRLAWSSLPIAQRTVSRAIFSTKQEGYS